MKKFIYRIICGFFLGLSVFAPGFSGSMIAIMMGVYQDIISIAANPFKELKKNIMFCIPLGIGVVISGVLFLLAFKFLFETYEKATYFLFIGLIFGNLPMIQQEIKKHEFQKSYILGGVVAFLAALILGLLAIGFTKPETTAIFTPNFILLAVGGFFAGVCLFIPGMSVSMVLIIFGIYRGLIIMAESLLHFNFTYLVPFGIAGFCALVGLVLTSNGIKYVFEKHPGFANSLVFGFMLGSLIGIIIQSLQLQDENFSWIFGSIMLVVGLGISLLFVVMGNILNKEIAKEG